MDDDYPITPHEMPPKHINTDYQPSPVRILRPADPDKIAQLHAHKRLVRAKRIKAGLEPENPQPFNK